MSKAWCTDKWKTRERMKLQTRECKVRRLDKIHNLLHLHLVALVHFLMVCQQGLCPERFVCLHGRDKLPIFQSGYKLSSSQRASFCGSSVADEDEGFGCRKTRFSAQDLQMRQERCWVTSLRERHVAPSTNRFTTPLGLCLIIVLSVV